MWAFQLGHQIEELFAFCPQQIRFTSPQPPSDVFVMYPYRHILFQLNKYVQIDMMEEKIAYFVVHFEKANC